MNEPRDPFEDELSALRPVETSPDLRRRLATRLADHSPVRLRRRWLPPLAAGLAAACLAFIVFRWQGGGRVEPRPIAIPTRTATPLTLDDATPMLLAYQRALARSPEDLVILLDKHAVATSGPGPGLVQTLGFGRSAAALDTLLGDD